MKNLAKQRYLKPLLALLLCGTTSICYADTRSYAATTDFPVIDAGEVPFYSEAPGRPSLAINAANEEFRDRFARAEVVYDGNEAQHDITIVALAELDGEADYRLLINGEVVGTATNPVVISDYTVVRHTFNDITVPVGAVLAVESLANTNGTIPEGDGTAFARGRWTGLELEEIETVEPDVPPVVIAPSDIDLDLRLSSNKTSLDLNEEFFLIMRVFNSESSMAATQPVVTLSIPLESISVVSANQCVESNRGLSCTFPEIAAGSSTSMTLALSSTDEPILLNLQAIVSADQDDREESNNMAELNIAIVDESVEPEPEPIDSTQVNSAPASSGGSLSIFWILLLIPTVSRYTKPTTLA